MDVVERGQVKKSPLVPGVLASLGVLLVLWFMFAPSSPPPVITKVRILHAHDEVRI